MPVTKMNLLLKATVLLASPYFSTNILTTPLFINMSSLIRKISNWVQSVTLLVKGGLSIFLNDVTYNQHLFMKLSGTFAYSFKFP